MNDIVDYSKKLKEVSNKQKKIFIFICILAIIFSFSIGFYLSYAFNDDSKISKDKEKLNVIYEILKDEWYYGIEDENIEKTLLDKAIYGMLDTEKDPFTRYLTSLGSLATTYEGLGITIVEYKEYFIITEVTSKINIDAGLRKGDILKSIDGNSLANKDSTYIKTLLENKDEVVIDVERSGIDLDIKCYITTYSPVTVFKDFSLSEEFAYIQITEFANDTASNLKNYLSEAKNQGYNRLILDLRDNPGGYITSVVDCADFFMGKGKVVLTTKDKNDNAYSYKTSSNDKYDFSNIIVLINENSASGAEALAAALNDNLGDKVDLYGSTTYGKGSAQKTIYFTDGTYFHYTYALWYTPSGETIHKVGVSPEITYVGSGIHLLAFNKVTLKENDYGEDVKNLQQIMKELNYYNGTINGIFAEDLKLAITNFQRDCEIDETGELDALTIRYLLARSYDDKVKDYRNEVVNILTDYAI